MRLRHFRNLLVPLLVMLAASFSLSQSTASQWDAAGQAAQKAKDYSTAIEDYKKAVLIDANYARAWMDLGMAYSETQQYLQANAAFRAYLQLPNKPGQNAAWLMVGLTYEKMEKFSAAADAFRALIRLNPEPGMMAKAHLELAKSLSVTGYLPESVAELKETLRLNPGDPDATQLLPEIEKLAAQYGDSRAQNDSVGVSAPKPGNVGQKQTNPSRTSDSVSSLMDSGTNYFTEKKFAEAIKTFEQVVRMEPNNARAHYGIGAAYEEMAQYDKAIPSLREAVRLDSSNASQWYDLGECLYETGQYPAAQQALEKAANLQPNDSLTDYWLGRTYVKVGNLFEAMAAYNRLIGPDGNTKPELSKQLYAEINGPSGDRSVPRSPSSTQSATSTMAGAKVSAGTSAQNFADQGDQYLKARNYQQAIAEYKKATALDPKLGLAYYGLGLCYHQTQQWQLAVDAWNHAKALLQPEGAMYITLGNDLYHLKRYDEALKSFQQAIAIHPPDIDVAVASYWIGVVYNEEKKFESAIQPLQTAVKLRSDDPDYRSELGKAYFGAEKFPEAATALKEAVRLRPNDGTALYWLGLAYVSLHQKDEALNVYQKLMPVDPQAARDLHEQILDEMGREIEKAIGGNAKP